MRTTFHISRLFIPVLILGLTSGAATALAQPERQRMDILAPLKAALQAAGAPALTSAQGTGINTFFAEFRNAHQNQAEITSLQSARMEYENAILYGDSATATSQAVAIANAQAVEMAQRDADAAVFAINVITNLKTNSAQYDALINQMGQSGLVRLVLSLVGGPGGFGPRGGGPGPNGPSGPGAPPMR